MIRYGRLIITLVAVMFALSLCADARAQFTALHDSAEDVVLAMGLDEPQIQQILNTHIGSPRETITFDDIASVTLAPGEFDDRLIGQGILLEAISGSTKVGGQSNSGPINGGHMDVSNNWTDSRVRVHFVESGTTTPTTVFVSVHSQPLLHF